MKHLLLHKYLPKHSLTVLDIGARGGLNPRWESVKRFINVIGFEPEPAECARLNEQNNKEETRIRFLPIALGRRESSNVFYICKQPGCSSLYKPNTDFVENFWYGPAMSIISTTTINTLPLTIVCAREDISPDYIKIDTQGSELDILEGGRQILPTVKLIELEVEFNPQYENQPLFAHIDMFMRDAGFYLLGLRRTNWRRSHSFQEIRTPLGGQIMHADAVYYNEQMISQRTECGLQDILKFLLILSVYGFDDFILQLTSSPHEALRSLDRPVRLALARELLGKRSRLLQFVQSLRRPILHTELRRWTDSIKYSGDNTDWHDPDFF